MSRYRGPLAWSIHGRLPPYKGFVEGLARRSWLLPSVRPVGAAWWAAGLDENPQASTRSCERARSPWTHSGCAGLGPDRSAITSTFALAARGRFAGSPALQRGVGLAAGEHCPQDARQLVGHGRDRDVERSACQQAGDPRPQLAFPTRRAPHQGPGAVDQLGRSRPLVMATRMTNRNPAGEACTLNPDSPDGWNVS